MKLNLGLDPSFRLAAARAAPKARERRTDIFRRHPPPIAIDAFAHRTFMTSRESGS